MVTVGICYGLGQHDSDLSLYDISKASEFAVISTVFIVFYIIILKLPILFLIERIFNVPKFHRIIFYGMMFILAALGISDVAVQFAQCTPSRGLWEPWLKPVCWTNGNIVPAVAITFSGKKYKPVRDSTHGADIICGQHGQHLSTSSLLLILQRG